MSRFDFPAPEPVALPVAGDTAVWFSVLDTHVLNITLMASATRFVGRG